ncbi:MAG: NAD(P)-binding protein [Sphingomonas sp.]
MKVSRRAAVAGGAVLATGVAASIASRREVVGGEDGGPSMARGHRLRDGKFPAPTENEQCRIAIVGGGVAGLSAGWMLADAGFNDFRLLELEDSIGGNARSGSNAISKFPLGAHYLPVPNREAKALRYMLEKFGIITATRDGVPVYDPYQLCADSQERLLWLGRWHEGLMPVIGLSPKDRSDFSAFHEAMAEFGARMGQDGRPAFAIPLAYSSTDVGLMALDAISFAAWLDKKGWRSTVLRNYLRYCCRDDYGCEPGQISAWAGIHYFASRRGWAADGVGENVLTWPEGNARLVGQMAKPLAGKIASGRIVFAVRKSDGGVEVDSFDARRGISIRTHAKAAVMALPHFVGARIAPAAFPSAKAFSYAPWLVANITLRRLPRGSGAKLAWDNVSATGDSLGYVVATHQSVASATAATVVTWYMPLSRRMPSVARRELLARSAADWRQVVEDDLLRMNPDLKGAIQSIDLWRWGHAMIRPEPGFIWRVAPMARAAAQSPFFLAHSDVSGMSLFEEAHYRGTAAAEGAMRLLGHPHESRI